MDTKVKDSGSNGKDPVMGKLEEISSRLQNVEELQEEILEKMHDLEQAGSYNPGFSVE